MFPKREIYLFQKKRNELVWKLANSMPEDMIPASLMYVHKTCNTPNCKCKKGDKHGPYPAIQFKSGNKYKIKMLKKNEVAEVESKVQAYREYQEGLAEINKLNAQINKLLQKLRNENLEEYL